MNVKAIYQLQFIEVQFKNQFRLSFLDSLSSLYSYILGRSQFCSVNSFYESTCKNKNDRKCGNISESLIRHTLCFDLPSPSWRDSRMPLLAPINFQHHGRARLLTCDKCHFIAPSFEILISSVHRIMSVMKFRKDLQEGQGHARYEDIS